ncbi:MAG: hypothetical protein HZB85_00820 [Deltaproteobacteria bacterium]|nr:hypothetical protein [Deltaproteobacteria bacterium]
MKTRFLAYILPLLLAFISAASAADNTVSQPVSVSLPSYMQGRMDGRPVSVSLPSYMQGRMDGRPVSVSLPSYMQGRMDGRPVSVKATAAGSVYPEIVAVYYMDNDWFDASGNGYNATPYSGAAFSAPGKVGSHAASFDGVDDYARVPHNAAFGMTKNITVEYWIKAAVSQKSNFLVIDKSHGTSGITGWLMQGASSGRIDWGFGNGSDWTSVISTTADMRDNAWHHLAGTYDGSVLKLYVDGVLDNSKAETRGIAQNTNPVMIGKHYSIPGREFNGSLDNIVIYNRALSDAEILEHYINAFMDTTPPATPAVTQAVSLTTSQIITLSGTKDADSSIWINGAQATAVDALTAWQVSYTLTQQGVNQLRISGKDAAGNESLPVFVTVALDNAAPAVVSASPANNGAYNTLITSVTVNLSDAYSGVDINATLNGASVTDAAGQAVAGAWTASGADAVIFTPTSAFTEGAYTVKIYPTDGLGNRALAQISFGYDVTAPLPPVINAVLTPTNVTSQTIQGARSLDTASVAVSLSSGAAGAVSYPTSTTWRVGVSGLIDGNNTVLVYAKDAAGNRSAPASAVITVDTVPPAAPVPNSVTSPTRDNSVVLLGAKDADSYVYVNSLKLVSSFADTAWSYTGALGEGSNTFTIYAADAADNKSQTVSVTVARDTTAPKIAASTPTVNSFTNQAGTIDVVLTDASDIDLQASLAGAIVKNGAGAVVAGAWATAQGHLVFTPSAAFTDSSYNVTLYPADALGNSAAVSFGFTLDTAPPAVQSLAMNPGSPHRAETVTFTITFNEDMSTNAPLNVTIGSGWFFPTTYQITGAWTGARTWSGSYTFTGATGDGTYTVKVKDAKDKAGNALNAQDAGTFELDTAAPAAPAISRVTTPTKNPFQALTGSKEANTAIIINNVQRVAVSDLTSWSYNYPLAEGVNNISATARDAAGNGSAPVTTAITLDTTPPVFTISPYQNPSTTQVQVISGTKEPGSTVMLNNVVIIDATDAGSTWSYSVALTEGATTRLTFNVSDSLGNAVTKSIDILYDTAPPASLAAGVLSADGSGRGTEAALSWPAYAEPADLGYYRLYYATSNFNTSSGMTAVSTVNKGTKALKVAGLTQGAPYYFAIVPVDTSGNFNAAVNTAFAVPADTAAPEDVTGLTATAGYGAVNGNYAALNWTASVNSTGDLAGQILYVDSGTGYDAGTPLGSTAVSYAASGLADAKRYRYRITTMDMSGHESAGVFADAVTRLANPTGLAAAPGNAKVALTWNAVNSPYVKQYVVYRKAAAAQQTGVGAMSLVKALTGTSFTDTGVVNGTTYQYAVTVLNTSGAEMTDVLSVSARPRQDETGPVIAAVNVTQGQIITAPLTVTASAQDAESPMGSVEIYVDSVLASSQTGAGASYFWNTVDVTDGNHTVTIKAVDGLGNVTTLPIGVIVSLAPPAVPSITSHIVAGTAPQYLVDINGVAPLFTNVTIRVNGVAVGQVAASTAGTFGYSGAALTEGDNFIAVKAVHRGGESAFSADYRIIVDTGAPNSPVNLSAKPGAGGTVQFTWGPGSGETPAGYNIYTSAAPFTLRTDAGVSRINTSLITYSLKEYIPANDNRMYYALSAVDSAGNESQLSNVVSASSDRVPPSVASLSFVYTNQAGGAVDQATVAGPGSVKVSLAVTEPLIELPFVSIEPQSGSPIVLTMSRIDAAHYQGTFTVNAQTPHGPTVYKFSGKDQLGNRGSGQGAGVTIDVHGPAASITSPATLWRITSAPVQVNVSFDEGPSSAPVMEIKDASGSSAPITNLLPVTALNWSGSADVSSLSDGNAEFVLKEAKDAFGNVSSTVGSGKTIMLYRDTVAPPPVPAGLVAAPKKGGAISLTWAKVDGALSYNVYRRAEGASSASFAAASPAASAADAPPADGVYYYSVASVGLLNSVSAPSAEVSVSSDGSAPAVPAGLTLGLSGSGVNVAWSAPSAPSTETPASYNVYRSGSPITSTAGLTPVAKATLPAAVDAAPVSTRRYYSVTALDSLGNESAPSDSVEIVFPVAPVRNLVLTKIDDGMPMLTWEASEAGIQGYFVYRNGSRITASPTPVASYTDGYYSGGAARYGISEVGSTGAESPIKEVILPDISLGIKPGTALRRGLIETVPVVMTSGSDVTVSSIEIKVGASAVSVMAGPFNLIAGAGLEVQKVAAADANAGAQTAVVTTAVITPAGGVTVRVSRTTAADVLNSGAALEVYSDPLMHGAQARVRLKVNNLGSARTEFLTSEGGGPTQQVSVKLKDQDGNLLASGNLFQVTGSVVNTGSYAGARITPGTSFLTDPVTFTVPAGAPYTVFIEASIQNTYYHYGQADVVTAPGLKTTVETGISDAAYGATASVAKDVYKQGEPVVITGQAISSLTGAPAALVPVKIGLSIKGFDRFYTVNTDASGNYSYTFTPGVSEAGTFDLWASHPDVTTKFAQARFSIAAIDLTPRVLNLRMAKNTSFDLPFTVKNLGDIEMTSVAFTPEVSPGVSAAVVNPGAAALAPGETRVLTYRVTAALDAPDNGFANLSVNTAQGVGAALTTNLSLVQAQPVIAASPSYIDGGIVRGSQKIEQFTITNAGLDTLRGAVLTPPSTPWMTLTTAPSIGDLKPGESRIVGVLVSPSAAIAQAIYDDRIVITSANHVPYTYNIQVSVTSNAVGGAMFDVLDDLIQDVSGASITIQHQMLLDLMYTVKTGADGTVSLFDIPEGRYAFNITAPGHKSYSGSFSVVPGLTVVVPVAMETTLVDIQWSVVPMTIVDSYEIKISQTFATNVPTPVLVTEPAGVVLPPLEPGGVYNGEFTVTNYGLIALDDARLEFPAAFDDYDIEVLSVIPATLAAMQKVTVPYRITRRAQIAAYLDGSSGASYASRKHGGYGSLFDEVSGYGGGSCYAGFAIITAGSAVICPGSMNERRVGRSSSHTVSRASSCGGGGSASTSYAFGPAPVGGSGGGGGSVPTTIGKDQCFSPACTNRMCEKDLRHCTGSSVLLSNGTYEFSASDLKTPAPSAPIILERTYRSNIVKSKKADDPVRAHHS